MENELLLIIFRDKENADHIHTYRSGSWTRQNRNVPMKVYRLSRGFEFITALNNSLKRETSGTLFDKVRNTIFIVKIFNIFLLNKTPVSYSID